MGSGNRKTPYVVNYFVTVHNLGFLANLLQKSKFLSLKWLVSIGFAVWLWMNDSSMQAMFIIGNLVLFYMPFGFPAIIANQILTSKYNMHPKYALLKHVYGKEYHFE